MFLSRTLQRISSLGLGPTTFVGTASTARGLIIPSYSRSLPAPANLSQPSPWADVTNEVTASLSQRLKASKRPQETNEEIWARQSNDAMDILERHPIHDPYHGRSVRVLNGDVGDAFKRLATVLSRNKVLKQLRMSERHEKKGVKRRRLQSERWRRLFAHEVRKSVQLVTKIRDRGA